MADTLPQTEASAWEGVPLASLEERLRQRSARIAVAGLGAVGLPLAELLHGGGFPISGIDPSPIKRAALEAGQVPLAHQAHLDCVRLALSPRFEVVAQPGDCMTPIDVLMICVPTDLNANQEPDLSLVRAVVAAAARHLADEALVVLESTTWPGTTREILGRDLVAAGRVPGVDVGLVFSPERVDPGREALASIPKLVGGLDARAGELGVLLYASAFDDVRQVSSPEVAEAAKLLENVYRAVNIGLVNELKTSFASMGLDVWEVLDAAASKPFGFQRFDPGPGVGGHCIPVDPHYLTWAARRAGAPARLVELAGSINARMPEEVARVTARALSARGKALDGARVLLVGIAYKAGVDAIDHAPALDLASDLAAAGALLEFHDPLVSELPAEHAMLRPELGSRSVSLDRCRIASYDAILILTAQSGLDLDLIAEAAQLVIDTRAVLRSRLLGDPRYVSA